MKNRINLSTLLEKTGAIFFSIGMMLGLGTVTFGLISCGGGGGGGSSNTGNTSVTITDINPPGIVASSVFQTLVLSGTNFASGVTVSFAGASGTPVVSSVAVSSGGSILTAVVKIENAPTNRYVTLTLQPPASATAVTHVLGVASVKKTYDNILATTYFSTCTGCHDNTLNGGLNLTSATNLNNEPSKGCSSRLRVKRGDPRRSSSFLIDKIQATAGSPACYGTPMPNAGPLMASEIQEIVEWVAGGAY